jgi:very-short-patch-repair endonuclease
MLSEVLVDSAHGFQGDERDIMIFSPVIARGITASACKWVESPPNLVNVALTRAKYALYVVADIEFCKQQDEILRSLATYVDDINTLRETSPAELELFSWMMVENMQPKVHPRIGDVEVDFVLTTPSGEQVAIEVDGAEYHEDRPTMDNARDAMLQGHGYRVVRVPAREVFETPYSVLEKIRQQTQLIN